ncbi:Uncharacterised protein [Enterobacter hormaechei]|nr:Uncharacterised protein [Enterobacter hormaechei]
MVIPCFTAAVIVGNCPANTRKVHRRIGYDFRGVVTTSPTSDNVHWRFIGNSSRKRPAHRRNHHGGMLNQAHQRFEVELAGVHAQIRVGKFADGPLLPLLQVSHTDYAEMLPQ